MGKKNDSDSSRAATPQPRENASPSSRGDYVKIALNYVLVLSVIFYLNHIGIPELIQVILNNAKDGKTTPLVHKQSSVSSPAIIGEFNDDEFMAQYKCNTTHGFGVKILKRDPLLMYISDFLAPGEAEHLQAIGYPLMGRSKVVGKEDEYHAGRTSHNAFLARSQDAVVQCVEGRASYISQKPVENIEPLQVVWYRDGQEYQPHYDFFPPGSDGADRELQRGGQRMITLFVYLNTVPEGHGGETVFPNLDMKVPAKKNDAAFWYDVDIDGKEDERTFHGGAPVHGSEKWGLNIWIRQGAFQ
jgi:prolyl 4-hydroxylase